MSSSVDYKSFNFSENINKERDLFMEYTSNVAKNANNEVPFVFSDEYLPYSEEIDKYFKEFILPLKENFKNYNLAVTGAIASGKSTILEILNKVFNKFLFKVNLVPEYLGIDKELGGKMLEKKISGNISNTTFQNYIMDQYKKRLEENSSENCNICLFERLPDDSILCFSNISHFDEVDLTTFDLFVLDKRMKALNEKYHIPTYRNEDSAFEVFTSNEYNILTITILKLIREDIINGIRNRIIGLDVSTNLTITRLNKRARPGEDGYSIEYLNRIVEYYKKLYHIMKTDRSLLNKFTCIGTLLA